MREIKFRAWDKQELEMYYPKHPYPRISTMFEWFEANYPIILMQFTGLHDKNGKDLYEGDICLKPSGTVEDIKDVEIDGETYRAYKSSPRQKGIVFNLGYAFFLGKEGNEDYYGVINHQRNLMGYDLEIIGNIYENPELISDL